MDEQVELRLEALKLLKEASTSLMTVQGGALAVIGALIEKTPPHGHRLWVIVALFASLIVSIFFGGIALLGSIPHVAQNLADEARERAGSIYDEKGGLSGIRSPQLGTLWKRQYQLFAVSLVLFGLFAIWR